MTRYSSFTLRKKEPAPPEASIYIFMGIPVVISKTKGHSYYYGDSMVKFFEPCNSGDLARAVIDLFRNGASREEQVRNSRRFIEKNSWATVKKVYVQIAGPCSPE